MPRVTDTQATFADSTPSDESSSPNNDAQLQIGTQELEDLRLSPPVRHHTAGNVMADRPDSEDEASNVDTQSPDSDGSDSDLGSDLASEGIDDDMDIVFDAEVFRASLRCRPLPPPDDGTSTSSYINLEEININELPADAVAEHKAKVEAEVAAIRDPMRAQGHFERRVRLRMAMYSSDDNHPLHGLRWEIIRQDKRDYAAPRQRGRARHKPPTLGDDGIEEKHRVHLLCVVLCLYEIRFLESVLEGNLKDALRYRSANVQALDTAQEPGIVTAIYVNALCGPDGDNITVGEFRTLHDMVSLYLRNIRAFGNEEARRVPLPHSQLSRARIAKIDQYRAPRGHAFSLDWPRFVTTKKSLQHGKRYLNLLGRMLEKVTEKSDDEKMPFPIADVGYTYDLTTRRNAHGAYRSSIPMMNLTDAILRCGIPGRPATDAGVRFYCLVIVPHNTWMSVAEHATSCLFQSYSWQAGFNVVVAGHSVRSSREINVQDEIRMHRLVEEDQVLERNVQEVRRMTQERWESRQKAREMERMRRRTKEMEQETALIEAELARKRIENEAVSATYSAAVHRLVSTMYDGVEEIRKAEKLVAQINRFRELYAELAVAKAEEEASL